jgi:hypothetical protein
VPTPLPDLVAAYFRQYRNGGETDFWAFEEVGKRVTFGNDEEDAWAVMIALVEAADDESLAYVGAGPLEDLVRRFGTDLILRIEKTARTNLKFRECLGSIWLSEGALPDWVLARVVRASGNRIRPLPAEG